MAGFTKEEAYFVPRCFLPLPIPINELEELLVPELSNWRIQSQSVGGDNTNAARNFLYDTIPFMLEVAVQDGIYFVEEFPNHSFR